MDYRRALIGCTLLLVCAFANAAEKKKDTTTISGKIVGGTNIDIRDAPHTVQILSTFGGHFCGGSLIHPQWILTAAHCVTNRRPASVSVRVGATYTNKGGDVIGVNRIIRHPLYSTVTVDHDMALMELKRPPSPQVPWAGVEDGSKDCCPKNPKKKKSLFDYDIALLKLFCPVDFNSSARVIRMATMEPSPGTMGYVSGYGVTREGNKRPSNQLQMVELPIMERKGCGAIYASTNPITSRMICAGWKDGGKDACQGDSGGPMVANRVQVGIVSWGRGCAQRGKPGVFSNVAGLIGWVRRYVPLGY